MDGPPITSCNPQISSKFQASNYKQIQKAENLKFKTLGVFALVIFVSCAL
jgi:hypothetical protein